MGQSGEGGGRESPFEGKNPPQYLTSFLLGVQPNFQAKTLTLLISPNFTVLVIKTKKMSENVEIYTTGKNFTLPPAVVTAGTNLTPGGQLSTICGWGGGTPKMSQIYFLPFLATFLHLSIGPKTWYLVQKLFLARLSLFLGLLVHF